MNVNYLTNRYNTPVEIPALPGYTFALPTETYQLPQNFLIEGLLQKNRSLEEENRMLKGLFAELVAYNAQNKGKFAPKVLVHPPEENNQLVLPSAKILDEKVEATCELMQDVSSPLPTQATPNKDSESMAETLSMTDIYHDEDKPSDLDDSDSDFEEKVPKIRRRNGFKADKSIKKEKNSDDKPKQRSKAKHLWIGFGRKIVEFGLKHTKGNERTWIKQHEKSLISKKAYSKVFRIKPSDSKETAGLKRMFGQLAIEFIRSDKEMEDAFPNSNYRNELVEQKEKVANWIEGLIF